MTRKTLVNWKNFKKGHIIFFIMSEFNFGSSKLIFNFKGVEPEKYSIIPRVNLKINVHYSFGSGPARYNINLFFTKSELKIKSGNKSYYYVGSGIFLPSIIELKPNSSNYFYILIDLDHFKLVQIEKLRGGGDIFAYVDFSFILEEKREKPVKYFGDTYFDFKISKSDWVEIFLSLFKFREVFLIEIPRIERPDFIDIIDNLNEAWKEYSMGSYDNVLVKCRKAMEGLSNIVKKYGFRKEITDEKGEKKTVPAWEKALAHRELGKIIAVLVQKNFGFLSPAAHYGKATNREDAELALMLTHGLINYISKKLPFQKGS